MIHLIYCRRRCYKTQYHGTAYWLNNFQCQREKKQQRSRGFVQKGMYGDQLFAANQSQNNICCFNGCYRNNPYPQPKWQLYQRKNFRKTHCHKHNVCNGIQPCARFADRVCFPRDCSVHHICNSAEQIHNIKRDRKCRTEHQTDTAQNPAECYYVCNLLFHLFTCDFKFVCILYKFIIFYTFYKAVFHRAELHTIFSCFFAVHP